MLNLILKIIVPPEEPFMRLWIKIPVLTLLVSVLGFAQKDATTRSLSGLKALEVLIEKLDPDIERDGLSREQLRTDIELRLRRAGIRLADDTPFEGVSVLDPYQEFRDKVSSLVAQSQSFDAQEKEKLIGTLVHLTFGTRKQIATLYLNVNTIKEDGRRFQVYSVELAVHQDALLDRDKDRFVPNAVTWERAPLGFVGARINAPQHIRQVVADLVDQFINDYLSVNPPGASK